MADNMISVIVPVYNMGKYLEKSVRSLLNQTYHDYEIIIVDDGSTDGSSALCDALAEASPIIRVVHQPNGGLSAARNTGIREANGRYVIFPDPDDWVDEHYLQSLANQCSEQTDLEICGYYIVTDKNTVVQNEAAQPAMYGVKDAIMHLLAQREYCGFAWNKLYHLDIIRANHLQFDEELGMAQDLHFAFRYILCCRIVSYDPAPHYYYVQHADGVTNIDHPLTARKLSGLQTYRKLLELSESSVPEAAPVIGATIANLNLSFLYIYHRSGMDDHALYDTLRANFRQYRKYFFRNKNYSVSHKVMGAIALVSPELYFRLKDRRNGG